MITIRYKNQNLDLAPDASLDFNFRAPYFFDQKGDVIPGSYSFPFQIPKTSKNMELLDYPHRIDFDGPLLQDQPVSIYYDGLHLFYADLYIKKGGDQIEAFLIAAEFKKLEDQKLSDVDYGGAVTLGANITAALATAKDTATNPNNYDYVFFPIRNDAFFPDGTGPTDPKSDWQNYYDDALETFISHADSQCAMPFLKLSFILDKIFTGQGLNFVNDWQINDELKNICIYNNYSIYEDADNWALTFDPVNHVPDLKSRDFIKELSKVWSFILIYNVFDNQVTLKPTKDLIQAIPTKDWSGYVARESSFVTPENKIDHYCFLVDEDDAENLKPLIVHDVLEIEDEVESLGDIGAPIPFKYYYQWSTNTVSYWTGSRWVAYQQGFRCFRVGSGEAELSIAAQPYPYGGGTPQMLIGGTSEVHEIETPLSHIRWIGYRGMKPDVDLTNDKPYASNMNYTTAPITKDGDYSHVWAGPYGIFETFWRPWHDFMTNSKEVSVTIFLPLIELISLDQSEKIRIGTQHYFVKTLKARFTKGKIIRCDAVLLLTN